MGLGGCDDPGEPVVASSKKHRGTPNVVPDQRVPRCQQTSWRFTINTTRDLPQGKPLRAEGTEQEGQPAIDPQAQADLVDAAVREWLPLNARDMEPRVREKIEPTVRACVEAAAPHTVQTARRMLRVSFGAFEWALAELGTTNRETVCHPDNVDHYVSEVNGHRSIGWQREANRTLEQVGRAVTARFWPRERTRLPKTGPALPYSPKEEAAFRLAATLKKKPVRAASAAVTSLTLGAGLSAIDIQQATPDDVVDLDDGRLGIWVAPIGQEPRLVPIRSDYTDLLNRAIEHSNGQRFVRGTSRNSVFQLAKRIEVHGLGHLCLTRARSTWLQAHLRAGTRLEDLLVIAGPLSMNTLNQLLGPLAKAVSPMDAAMRGLGA